MAQGVSDPATLIILKPFDMCAPGRSWPQKCGSPNFAKEFLGHRSVTPELCQGIFGPSKTSSKMGPKMSPNCSQNGPLLAPKWHPFGPLWLQNLSKNRSKNVPVSRAHFWSMDTPFGLILGPLLEPFWPHFRAPKRNPSLFKKPYKT